MSELLLLGASGLLFAMAYVRFRERAYPVGGMASDRVEATEARRLAIDAVRRLTGLDVGTWRSASAVWFDEELTERLHQVDNLGPVEPVMRSWGLRGSWRTRFLGDGGSVLVGVSARGEVLMLELDGSVVPAPTEPGQYTDDEIRQVLDGPAGPGVWSALHATGAGFLQSVDGRVEHTRRFEQEVPGLRVSCVVQAQGRTITGVACTPVATAPGIDDVQRAEVVEALAGAGSLLGALVALLTGVTLLAVTDGSTRVAPAVGLAAVVVVAVVVQGKEDLRYTVVNGFESGLSWPAFRIINHLMTLTSALAMAGVVGVSAVAGTLAADRIGLSLFSDAPRQVLWGVWLGTAWLGIAASVYAALRQARKVAISPTVSKRWLRTAGHDWRQAASVTAQSAVGEETLFRLLGVPVLIWMLGSAWLAVPLVAALWAFMHSGSAVRPRVARFVELTVVGWALGVALVNLGFWTALGAHGVYNGVSLAAPLLAANRAEPGPEQRRRSPACEPKRSPLHSGP